MLEKLLLYIQTKPRRSIVIALFILLAIFVLPIIINRLTTGTVVIETDDSQNLVTISALNTINSNEHLAQTTGGLKARLSPGTYVAVVGDRQTLKNRVIHVSARHTATYTINLSEPLTPEAVLPEGATAIVANDSQLNYLSSNDNALYTLSADGLPKAIDGNKTFGQVKWLNPQYGVGLSQDNEILYAIRDGIVTQIKLPFTIGGDFQYDLSPSDGRLIISNGNSVYYQQPGGNFTKIYTTNTKGSISSLAASKDKIALNLASGHDQKNENDSDSDLSKVIVITNQGSVLSTKDGLSVQLYTWSPDGKFLAITGNDGTVVLNSRLEQVKQINGNNLTSISWLDGDTVLYALNGNIMNYTVSRDETFQMTAYSGESSATSVTDIYAMPSGDAIYFSSISNTDISNGSIQRLWMKNNNPDYYSTLDIFFPSYSDQCNFSYSNFIKPTLVIAAWTDEVTCTDAAREELRADSLPLGDFTIVFTPLAVD